MAHLSDYTETNILQTTLRGQAFPVPAGNYLALCTGDPGEASIANEATGGWYSRLNLGTLTSAWSAPADSAGGKMSQNANLLAFNAVTGSGVTITHIAIMDAASGGNVLYWAPLAAPKVLAVTDVLQFAPSALQVTVK